jgi:hypothetical protein
MDTSTISICIWLFIGCLWTLSQWEKAWRKATQMGFRKWFPISVILEIILWPIGMLGSYYVKRNKFGK